MRAVIVFGVLPVLCGLSFATAAAPKKQTCDDTLSNQALRQCYLDSYTAADKELNSLFAKAKKSLADFYGAEEIKNAGGQEPVLDLVDAQRKWVSFRDANCRSLGTQMLGGSGQETIVSSCLARMTKERVEELKTFVSQ